MNNKRYGLKAETMLRDILKGRGYLVIRSAASKVIDLIVLDLGCEGNTYGLEIKRTSGDVVRISRTAYGREQREQLLRIDEQYPIYLWYAVMFGDGTVELFRPMYVVFRKGEGIKFDDFFDDCSLPTQPPYSPPVEGDARDG